MGTIAPVQRRVLSLSITLLLLVSTSYVQFASGTGGGYRTRPPAGCPCGRNNFLWRAAQFNVPHIVEDPFQKDDLGSYFYDSEGISDVQCRRLNGFGCTYANGRSACHGSCCSIDGHCMSKTPSSTMCKDNILGGSSVVCDLSNDGKTTSGPSICPTADLSGKPKFYAFCDTKIYSFDGQCKATGQVCLGQIRCKNEAQNEYVTCPRTEFGDDYEGLDCLASSTQNSYAICGCTKLDQCPPFPPVPEPGCTILETAPFDVRNNVTVRKNSVTGECERLCSSSLNCPPGQTVTNTTLGGIATKLPYRDSKLIYGFDYLNAGIIPSQEFRFLFSCGCPGKLTRLEPPPPPPAQCPIVETSASDVANNVTIRNNPATNVCERVCAPSLVCSDGSNVTSTILVGAMASRPYADSVSTYGNYDYLGFGGNPAAIEFLFICSCAQKFLLPSLPPPPPAVCVITQTLQLDIVLNVVIINGVGGRCERICTSNPDCPASLVPNWEFQDQARTAYSNSALAYGQEYLNWIDKDAADFAFLRSCSCPFLPRLPRLASPPSPPPPPPRFCPTSGQDDVSAGVQIVPAFTDEAGNEVCKRTCSDLKIKECASSPGNQTATPLFRGLALGKSQYLISVGIYGYDYLRLEDANWTLSNLFGGPAYLVNCPCQGQLSRSSIWLNVVAPLDGPQLQPGLINATEFNAIRSASSFNNPLPLMDFYYDVPLSTFDVSILTSLFTYNPLMEQAVSQLDAQIAPGLFITDAEIPCGSTLAIRSSVVDLPFVWTLRHQYSCEGGADIVAVSALCCAEKCPDKWQASDYTDPFNFQTSGLVGNLDNTNFCTTLNGDPCTDGQGQSACHGNCCSLDGHCPSAVCQVDTGTASQLGDSTFQCDYSPSLVPIGSHTLGMRVRTSPVSTTLDAGLISTTESNILGAFQAPGIFLDSFSPAISVASNSTNQEVFITATFPSSVGEDASLATRGADLLDDSLVHCTDLLPRENTCFISAANIPCGSVVDVFVDGVEVSSYACLANPGVNIQAAPGLCCGTPGASTASPPPPPPPTIRASPPPAPLGIMADVGAATGGNCPVEGTRFRAFCDLDVYNALSCLEQGRICLGQVRCHDPLSPGEKTTCDASLANPPPSPPPSPPPLCPVVLEDVPDYLKHVIILPDPTGYPYCIRGCDQSRLTADCRANLTTVQFPAQRKLYDQLDPNFTDAYNRSIGTYGWNYLGEPGNLPPTLEFLEECICYNATTHTVILNVTSPADQPPMSPQLVLDVSTSVLDLYQVPKNVDPSNPSPKFTSGFAQTSNEVSISSTYYESATVGDPLELARDAGALRYSDAIINGTSFEGLDIGKFVVQAMIPCGSTLSITIDPQNYSSYPLAVSAPPGAGINYFFACEADATTTPVTTTSVQELCCSPPSAPPPPPPSPLLPPPTCPTVVFGSSDYDRYIEIQPVGGASIYCSRVCDVTRLRADCGASRLLVRNPVDKIITRPIDPSFLFLFQNSSAEYGWNYMGEPIFPLLIAQGFVFLNECKCYDPVLHTLVLNVTSPVNQPPLNATLISIAESLILHNITIPGVIEPLVPSVSVTPGFTVTNIGVSLIVELPESETSGNPLEYLRSQGSEVLNSNIMNLTDPRFVPTVGHFVELGQIPCGSTISISIDPDLYSSYPLSSSAPIGAGINFLYACEENMANLPKPVFGVLELCCSPPPPPAPPPPPPPLTPDHLLVLTVNAPPNGPVLVPGLIQSTTDTVIGPYTIPGISGPINPTPVPTAGYNATSWDVSFETPYYPGPPGNPLQPAKDFGADRLNDNVTGGNSSYIDDFVRIAGIPCGSVLSIAIDPTVYGFPLPLGAPPNAGLVYQYACEAVPNSVPIATIAVPSLCCSPPPSPSPPPPLSPPPPPPLTADHLLVLIVTAPPTGSALDPMLIMSTKNTVLGMYEAPGVTGLVDPTPGPSFSYPNNPRDIAIETPYHSGPSGNPLQLLGAARLPFFGVKPALMGLDWAELEGAGQGLLVLK
eukprot:gene14580-20625_t